MKLIYFVLFVFVLRGTGGVYWPCESNDDCSAVGSVCSVDVGLCKCEDFDSVFSSDYSKCLKTSQFDEECEESIQCNLMPSGASCKLGVCDCADGQIYAQGRCRPINGLGEPCNTDIDCYFGYDRQSVSCRNQICECANGYYHRYGNICRRISMDLGDACVVDTDCSELGKDVKCVNLSCRSNSEVTTESSSTITTQTVTVTSTPSETSTGQTTSGLENGGNDRTDTEVETASTLPKLRDFAVQTSIDSFELKPLAPIYKNVATATGSEHIDSRRFSHYKRRAAAFRPDDEDKTFSTLSNTDDDVEDKKFGSSCTENGKICVGLPHSICSSNMCLCKQGYYHKSGKCFSELGEIAESIDECEHTYDELTKKCICQKNYFYDRSLRACRKPIQYHLSCTQTSQCSPFGAVFCHPDVPRRCTCEEYAEYDELQQMCVYKQGLGAECDTNDGCPIQHSVCSNRYCVCKENYTAKEGECVAGVGVDCETDDECLQENSVCEATTSNSESKEKSCQCRKGFVHFKDECLKEAEDIEDACIETEQCKPLLGTCIEQKCTCTEEQHFKYGRCENNKVLGDACARAGECFTEKDPEKVECRNSVCQCKFGYQTDATQRTCIRVMPNKKNSSGRPSALKIITFLLIGSAFLITSAAIKQAYY